MMDFILIMLSTSFFGLTWWLVKFCEGLSKER